MKKILILLGFILVAATSFGQFVNTTTTGSATTDFKSKGGITADSLVRLSPIIFADTTAANFSVVSKYSGSIIQVAGGQLWYRTLIPNQWYKLSASTGGNFLLISDTAAMLSNRLKISDTATMLSNRLKISDTATMKSTVKNITIGGLTVTGAVNMTGLSPVSAPYLLYITAGGVVSYFSSTAGGTVTSVSATVTNGATVSVTNPSTTPVLAFTFANLTPTSVVASGNITATNVFAGNIVKYSDTALMLKGVTLNRVAQNGATTGITITTGGFTQQSTNTNTFLGATTIGQTSDNSLSSPTGYAVVNGSLLLNGYGASGRNAIALNATNDQFFSSQFVNYLGAAIRKGTSWSGATYVWQDYAGGNSTLGTVTEGENVRMHTVTGGASGIDYWWDAANTRAALKIDYGNQLTSSYFPVSITGGLTVSSLPSYSSGGSYVVSNGGVLSSRTTAQLVTDINSAGGVAVAASLVSGVLPLANGGTANTVGRATYWGVSGGQYLADFTTPLSTAPIYVIGTNDGVTAKSFNSTALSTFLALYNYVPYTGATSGVNLGSNFLTTTGLGTFGNISATSNISTPNTITAGTLIGTTLTINGNSALNGATVGTYSGSAINNNYLSLYGSMSFTGSGSEAAQQQIAAIGAATSFSSSSNFTPNTLSKHGSISSTIYKGGNGSFLGTLSGNVSFSELSGLGSITTLAGFRAAAPAQQVGFAAYSATVTNAVGLLIDDITASAISSKFTNKYAIWQQGTSDIVRLDGILSVTGITTVSGITSSTNGVVFSANSLNSNAYKIGFQDNGIARGFIGASSNSAFQVAGATGVGILFSISTTGVVYSSGISNTGNVSTAGINFTSGGTGTLGYFQEGTVTVTATATTGSITLTDNTLTYSRIGNTVYFSGFISVSSVSSPTGTLTINGLPFASANNNRNYAAVSVRATGLGGVTTAVQGYVNKGTSTIIIEQMVAGSAATLAGQVSASSSFIISGSYSIN
jgi:hypothetical protein